MQKLMPAIRWSNVLLVLLTFLVYLSPFVSPQEFWPLAVLGLFYPAILIFHLLFILLWSMLRKWQFVLSLGCVLMGWGHVRTIVGFSMQEDSRSEISGTATLAVMTFNCHSFSLNSSDEERIEPEKLSRLLKTHQPDIICFQEFANTPQLMSTFSQWVKNGNNYPHVAVQSSPALAIFSRYPLENKQAHRFEHSFNGYQHVDVNLNGRKIRLFNLHLQTNAISHLADKVAATGDLKSKETWLDMGGMIRRYRRAARMRVEQAGQVLAQVGKAPFPVFICGDFNDVPQSYVYRSLKQDRIDTFQESGRGLGMTYAGRIPGLRIDYVFTPPDFPVLQTKILRPGFSDHRPVMSTILLK